MTTEHPALLLADINEAAAALCSSGKPHLAQAVLQLRDLSAKQDPALEALTALMEKSMTTHEPEPAGVIPDAAVDAAHAAFWAKSGPMHSDNARLYAALLAAQPFMAGDAEPFAFLDETGGFFSTHPETVNAHFDALPVPPVGAKTIALYLHPALVSAPEAGKADGVNREWFERRVRLEDDLEVGGGFTVGMSEQGARELDRIAFDALPPWAKEQLAARAPSSAPEAGKAEGATFRELVATLIRQCEASGVTQVPAGTIRPDLEALRQTLNALSQPDAEDKRIAEPVAQNFETQLQVASIIAERDAAITNKSGNTLASNDARELVDALEAKRRDARSRNLTEHGFAYASGFNDALDDAIAALSRRHPAPDGGAR